MLSEYNLFQDFQNDLKNTKAIRNLYFMTYSAADAKSAQDAADISGMVVPFFGSNVSSFFNMHAREAAAEAENHREKIGEAYISTLKKKIPEHFETKEQAYTYVKYINLIQADGQSFLNETHRAELNLIAQKVHTAWEHELEKYSNEQQAAIRTELAGQRQKLDDHFAQQRTANRGFQEGIENCGRKIEASRRDNAAAHRELSTHTQQILRELKKQGVQLDEGFENILESNQELSEQMGKVQEYLAAQQSYFIAKEKAEAEARAAEEVMRRHAADLQGLTQAFGAVYALGQEFGSPILSGIGLAGQEGVKIYAAFEAFSASSGLAMLGPIGAIAMSSLALYSFFKCNKSEDPMQAVMRQLQAIQAKMAEYHLEEMRAIAGIGQQLSAIADQIYYQFEQIQFLIAVPVMRQLNEIEAEVNHVARMSEAQFTALSLQPISDIFAAAHDFARGIRVLSKGSEVLNEDLSRMREYLMVTAFDRLHTGQFLLDESGATIWQKIAMLSQFALMPNYLAGYLAHQKSLSLPNIDIWSRTCATYLLLRLYADSDMQVFDPRGVQLNDVIRKLGGDIKAIETMRSDPNLISGLIEEIALLSIEVQENFRAILAGEEADFAAKNGGKALFSGSAQVAIDTTAIVKDRSFPARCGYQHAPGSDSGKRKGRHRNVDPGTSIALLINAKGISTIFPEECILGFMKGELTISMTMYQSMTNGGEQTWRNTEGEFYGLKIICQYRGGNYQITSPSPRSGVWDDARRNHEIAANSSHRKNAGLTIVNTVVIQSLVDVIRHDLANQTAQQFTRCFESIDTFIKNPEGPFAKYTFLQRKITAYASLLGTDELLLEQLRDLWLTTEGILANVRTSLNNSVRPELKLAAVTEYMPISEAMQRVLGYSPSEGQLRLTLRWLTSYKALHDLDEAERNSDITKYLRAQLVHEISSFTESAAYPTIQVTEFLGAIGVKDPELFLSQISTPRIVDVSNNTMPGSAEPGPADPIPTDRLQAPPVNLSIFAGRLPGILSPLPDQGKKSTLEIPRCSIS